MVVFGYNLLIGVATAMVGVGIKKANLNTVTESGEKIKAISEGKNPDLLLNTENLLIWKADAVFKAADRGIDHKLEEKP